MNTKYQLSVLLWRVGHNKYAPKGKNKTLDQSSHSSQEYCHILHKKYRFHATNTGTFRHWIQSSAVGSVYFSAHNKPLVSFFLLFYDRGSFSFSFIATGYVKNIDLLNFLLFHSLPLAGSRPLIFFSSICNQVQEQPSWSRSKLQWRTVLCRQWVMITFYWASSFFFNCIMFNC